MLSNTEGEVGTDAKQNLKEVALRQNPPFLPHTTSGTTDAHAAEQKQELLTFLLDLSQGLQKGSAQELNTPPKSELCQEQHNPIQHLLSRTPGTAAQSLGERDKPKAMEQMQEQSCKAPFHNDTVSSNSPYLAAQHTPWGKGREQKCPGSLLIDSLPHHTSNQPAAQP